MSDVLAPPTPIVFIEGDDVFASSLGIAQHFGKQHNHVLRDIDDWIAKLNKAENDRSSFGPINQTEYFVPTDYIDNGRTYRVFNLNRPFDAIEALLRAGPKRHSKAKVEPAVQPASISHTAAMQRETRLSLQWAFGVCPKLSEPVRQTVIADAMRPYFDLPHGQVDSKLHSATDIVKALRAIDPGRRCFPNTIGRVKAYQDQQIEWHGVFSLVANSRGVPHDVW